MMQIPNMQRPSRPPGPAKRFKRYFTIPITEAIKNGFEKVKWRARLDKTEVARRIMEYFLALPPEDQDKIIGGFDSRDQMFKRNSYAPRPVKPKLRTAIKIGPIEPVAKPVEAPQIKPQMKRLLTPTNRSGLE